MSEEEKKAIEVFKEILFERDKINEIEDEEEREIEKSAYFEEMAFDEIEIVLNLIEKQQKEIEELKENKEEYIKKLEETKNKLVRYIAIKEGKDYEQVCREFEI